MLIISITLFCTLLSPTTSIAFLWNIIFGKGGHIRRVRNIETARSLNKFTILDFIGLVERHDYPSEEHEVITEDGYHLQVHRIPGSPSQPKSKGKPVVYLQHGILASSDSLVLMGPGNDLAFLLADAGYDVWLGNHRGNTYGRFHKTLNPDRDPDFWKFSYHEIALFDVANTIDYILGVTGEKSLVYVGHSMGTTMSFVLLSSKPEFNDKIRLNVCLAPVSIWKHKLEGVYRMGFNYAPQIQSALERNQLYEILPLTEAGAKFGTTFCSEKSIFQPTCVRLFFQISGYNFDQLNLKIMPYVLSYFPAGTSTKILYHYYQNILSGRFSKYDYGAEKNFVIYGQDEPPSYNLKNIRVPVALIYGEGDLLSKKEDAEELSKHLPNVVTLEKVPHSNFSHLDFLWAKNIRPLLNERILQLVEKFSNEFENESENSISNSHTWQESNGNFGLGY